MINMWKKRSFNSDGFTLLEVLISMALIGIALLGIFRLQGQNLGLQSEARFLTVARFLAQERMASIQANKSIESGSNSGDFGESFPGYSYQEEIENVEDLDNLYKVTVTVSTEGEGSNKLFFEIKGLVYAQRE